jgi:hypothetical protein
MKHISKDKKGDRIGTFYMKCFFLFLPFILILVFYFIADPFMVLRKYHDYDHNIVAQNEGAIGWYKYKMYRDSVHYDSFIMGNSCTMSYMGEAWKKHIHGTPFRLFANSEGLPGLYLKLNALDHQPNQPIRNLLIVLDNSIFKKEVPLEDCFHIMPPEVSGASLVKYHATFLQGFFTPDFFGPYITYILTHRYKKSLMKGVINPDGMSHYGIYNDARNPNDHLIKTMGKNYWLSQPKWIKEVQDAKVHEGPNHIGNTQYDYLVKIQEICRKHHTNIKIIISPNQDKKLMNRQSLRILQEVFGKRNVFDFTRAGDYYSNIYHYYDAVHYRNELADTILNVVYAQ